MKIPAVKGIIKRRILINYRVEPEVIQKILPAPFRPKLYNKKAIAGICLIRLEHICPTFLPEFLGFASENAAHRISVCWEDENKQIHEGVYVPRRDSDSLINTTIGEKLFSGVYYKGKFKIKECAGELDFEMKSEDGDVSVVFTGKVSDSLPKKSIFPSLAAASMFFEKGSLGYSPRKTGKIMDGICLQIRDWKVSAFKLHKLHSSFYDNEAMFPKGSLEFDHALLMQNIVHEWHSATEINLA